MNQRSSPRNTPGIDPRICPSAAPEAREDALLGDHALQALLLLEESRLGAPPERKDKFLMKGAIV